MADWYQTAAKSSPLPSKTEKAAASSSLPFISRRSPVVCRTACVASSQPLATAIGYDLLRQGANAAEAAIAVAAALAVTEPCSTGLGGDAFLLHYEASDHKVTCVNGSGQSPSGLSIDAILQLHGTNTTKSDIASAFRDSPLAVTVPGAAKLWEDTLRLYGSGKFTLAQVLEPAAQLAEQGFPVAPVTAHHWTAGLPQIRKWRKDGEESNTPLLGPNGGTQISPGTIITNPDMARVLRSLGDKGALDGFYRGSTGQAIVDAVQHHGGCLKMDDLVAHTSLCVEPLSLDFSLDKNISKYKLWQAPPNGQGVAGMIALAGWEALLDHAGSSDAPPPRPLSADWYHRGIEMMRLGFADARAHVADPMYMTKAATETLLDRHRMAQQAQASFDNQTATQIGTPEASSCTVSFQVVDARGNAISFVNSNYMGFGTGLVPKGCGFTLQNRGFGFRLDDPQHPNYVGPSKRPLHTILPGILTHADTNELYATFTNMGGNMQPQGHLQLTLHMLSGAPFCDPQTAVDRPRFCIADGTQHGVVSIEEGVDPAVIEELRRRGHVIRGPVGGFDRSVFGRAQIIKRDRETGVLWAGSDGRADGCAMGF